MIGILDTFCLRDLNYSFILLGRFIDNISKAATTSLQNGVRRIYKDLASVRPCINHTLTSAFFLEFCYFSSGGKKEERKLPDMQKWEKKQTNKYENISQNKKKAAAEQTTKSPMCPLSTVKCDLAVQCSTIRTARKLQTWVHNHFDAWVCVCTSYGFVLLRVLNRLEMGRTFGLGVLTNICKQDSGTWWMKGPGPHWCEMPVTWHLHCERERKDMMAWNRTVRNLEYTFSSSCPWKQVYIYIYIYIYIRYYCVTRLNCSLQKQIFLKDHTRILSLPT